MAHGVPKTASLSLEIDLWNAGKHHLYGIDEAGRGAWAGPVAAGAVCLPCRNDIDRALLGVNDSKQLSGRQRMHLADTIKQQALCWGVGFASAAEIDALGIVAATCLAMKRALDHALTLHDAPTPDHLLVDSIPCQSFSYPFYSLVKGDSRSLSIAAASILAKVSRDALMVDLAADFPAYGFDIHKGYGTALHRAALDRSGPCDQHRRSFQPIRAHFERLL